MSAIVQLAERESKPMRDRNRVYTSNRHCLPYNVSVRESAAVNYWCRHFNTTPERLIDAVKEVGTNPTIVRLQLCR